MLRNFFTLFFLILCFAVSGQDKALMPYLEFLEKQNTNPADYVFDLFKKYDIVILGERDHRDTTQYVLINKIMSDPRFIQNVGHVFTEVGVYNQTDNANRILKGNYAFEEDFTKDLRNLYRNIDYGVIWEKYNYWQFLNNIYRINKNLPQNEKITLYLTDVPYDWKEYRDTLAWNIFYKKISTRPYRDIIMGVNIIRGFEQILQDSTEHRKKALIILNRPHSYQDYLRDNRKNLKSVASYVFDYYPGMVANVMINWRKLEKKDYLIADGKWDAAFHFMKNPSLGFDMKGSPFGDDLFDHYDKPANDTRYKDIYTGFIFYEPIEDWALTLGIPNIITNDFNEELMRRVFIANLNVKWNLDEFVKFFNNKRTSHINDEELIINLKKWKVE